MNRGYRWLMLSCMILGLSLAVILGVGGTSEGSDAPVIPDSPGAALSLEHVEPQPPLLDPWLDLDSGSMVQTAPTPAGEPSPEQIFGALTFLLVLAGALGIRADRAQAATATVRSRLRDNLFSDVTHGDLAVIEETVNGLPPGERNLVLDTLSDHEVGVWMRELDGFNGSFSKEEEIALFAGLVPGVDGEALARLAVNGKGREVVDALSNHGSSVQRLALAVELAELVEGRSRVRRLIPRLIAEADPISVEAEVSEWISNGEIGDRLEQFLGVDVEEPGPRPPGYRLDALAALAVAGAGFADPRVKGALFVKLVREATGADGKRWDGSLSDVLAGTTLLLRSDVTGVLRQLNHGLDPHGNVFGRWVEEMINEDRIDELDVVLADLLGGADRLSHFSDPGTNPADPYPNASNLGYFVGSYQLAIDQIADDAESKIELVGTLFALVTGAIPSPQGVSLKLPLGPLVDLRAQEVIDGFHGQAGEIKQTLWGLAKPRTKDGLLWNGPGTTQFQDSWEEVVEVR